MRVSVCVATKNRTDMLHQLLWSLIRQQREEWDLVIVDDSDAPVPWDKLGVYPRLLGEIGRTGHDIRVVQGPRVNRIGAAYQVGLAASNKENPLFLRVDDDSWLEPDYLARLVDIMRDPNVGACGGLFLHPGQEIHTMVPGDSRYKHATIDNLSDSINIQWFKHSAPDPIAVDHLTANILFNREWLGRIGGFETRLYNQHRDETQVTWRLHVEGAKLFVEPNAVAWHLRGVNGGARGHAPAVYLEDHRRFMAQRRTMRPGIHLNLGHAIGDGLMATPMIQALAQKNPGREIAVYAPWAEAILKGNPDVSQIAAHPLDAQRTERIEESVYAWASANKWGGHLGAAYCRMLGLPDPKDVTPTLHLSPEELSGPPELESLDRDYVVVAPWSGAKTLDLFGPSGNKNWFEERWRAVVRFVKQKGLAVVGLRGAEDEPAMEGIDLDICGKSLRSVFGCIAGARLLISVDTMAHHASVALGTPCVVLWGRSKPIHFGYSKPSVINLEGCCPGLAQTAESSSGLSTDPAKIRDRPCIGGDQWSMDRESCPLEGHPCMASITVGMVTRSVEKLLAGPAPTDQPVIRSGDKTIHSVAGHAA